MAFWYRSYGIYSFTKRIMQFISLLNNEKYKEFHYKFKSNNILKISLLLNKIKKRCFQEIFEIN
jgi:hypothetical protein